MYQQQFQHPFDQQANALVTKVHTALNKARATKKLKRLLRNKLGDVIASTILGSGGIGYFVPNGLTLPQFLGQQCNFAAYQAEFLMFEHKLNCQPIEDPISVAFDEMLKSAQHRGMLIGVSSFTHASFAFRQTGVHQDVYQIGVLQFQADLHIDKVVEVGLNYQTLDSGYIIIGKVSNPSKKPFALVLNRGQPSMAVVGPNRIYYDSLNGEEFKIFVPCNYNNLPAQLHPMAQAQPSIEVYSIDANDKSVRLANEMAHGENHADMTTAQDPAQYQNLTQGFVTFLAPAVDYKQLPDGCSLFQALAEPDLMKLVNGQAQSAGQIRQPSSNLIERLQGGASRPIIQPASAQNQPVIKKTRQQLLREENARLNRNRVSDFTSNQMVESNISPRFGNQTMQVQVPRFQLNNTFGGPQSSVQSRAPSQVNKFQLAVQNTNIQAPKFQFAQNPVTQTNPFTSQQRPNPFQSQASQATNFNPTFQPNYQQQPTYQPTYQQQPVQNQTPVYQPAYQVPKFQFSNQHQTNQNGGFQSYQSQQTFQPFNSRVRNTNEVMQIAQEQPRTAYNPIPVRFALNGAQQLQDSKLRLQPYEIGQMTFSQLSLTDQQILQTCLEELSRSLTSHELKRAEALMLEHPYQFYDIYQQCAQKQNQSSKKDERNSEKQPKKSEKKKTRDLDDYTLFVIIFAEKRLNSSLYIKEREASSSSSMVNWSTAKVLRELTEGKITPQQAINSIVFSKDLPRNDNFIKLYTTNDTATDMVFVLRHEEFKCHQIVFNASDFLKSCMKQNNEMNKRQNGTSLRVQKFYLPEWIAVGALKQFIRFAYTGQILAQGQKSLKPEEALDLLRVACYFHDKRLQEVLIATEIFPNMSTSAAVLFLKETSEWEQISPCQRAPDKRASTFLADYCVYYLTKNLPVILRQDRRRLADLSLDYLWELVRTSFNYTVDAKADIDITLQFAAEIFTQDKSVYSLFNQVHGRIQGCCGFDSQAIAKIADVKDVDPSSQSCVPILSGYDFAALQPIKKKTRDSTAFDVSQENINPGASQQKHEELLKPGNNVFELPDGQPDTVPIKKPALTLEIDLQEKGIQDVLTMHEARGVSILSKAFNSERRSWHVKIDICARTKNISVWIVERGETIDEESKLARGIPLQFSSVKCQIEVVDAAIKNKKSVFFFSYSHDQNQVVGHKDIANLDHLADSKVLKVRVAIEEYIFHSALIHHFANNFQRRFKEEYQREEAPKYLSPVALPKPETGLLYLPDQVLYWLLASDYLKVEDEHQVLSFVFQLTKLRILRKGLPSAITSANLLTRCLRFNFIEIYNMMSALRKNESLQLSEVFCDGINYEVHERLQLGKRILVAPATSDERQVYTGRPRKYFENQLTNQHGRAKLQSMKEGSQQALFEEIIKWALNSKTEMIVSTGPQRQGDQRYLSQLYEEKARNARLAEELRVMTVKLQTQTNAPYRSPPVTQMQTNHIPAAIRPLEILPVQRQPYQREAELPKAQAILPLNPVKREHPYFLQSKKDNLAQSIQTLKLDDVLSPIKRNYGDDKALQRSLEVLPLKPIGGAVATKREERRPPASIAGNESLDLSKILERVNRSPATPALKSRTITNKYLAGKTSDKENCLIF